MENPIIKDIRNRIYNKEENCLILFTGKVRCGKSLCGWELCHDVDPNFTNEHVVFDMKNFYKLIKDEGTNNRAILIDEMGVKADKREFMKYANKAIRWTFQTFAHKCNLVVMTVPTTGYIDEGIMKEVTYHFVKERTVKRDGKLVKTKFGVFMVQHNSRTNETYEKHPVFTIDGRRVVVKDMWLYPPCEADIKEYKRYSIPYKNSITANIEDNLNEMEEEAKEKKKARVNNLDDMVEKAVEVYDTLKNNSGEELNIAKVAAYFDIGDRVASKIRARVSLLKNKGGSPHTQPI